MPKDAPRICTLPKDTMTRADAIKKYMQSKGMDAAKLQSTSKGAMEATGTDEPSWAKDRRVDVELL